MSSMLWRVRGRLVSWANSSVGIQSCPTPPGHPAVRSVPTRQWYVRVLDSTGWTLVWLLCDLLGWATVALNHRLPIECL